MSDVDDTKGANELRVTPEEEADASPSAGEDTTTFSEDEAAALEKEAAAPENEAALENEAGAAASEDRASPAKSQRPSQESRPYLNPYLAGFLLGLVLFLAFFLTGNGLGASGALSRFSVFFESLVAGDHVDRTAYLVKMAGGARNPLDHWLIPMFLGAILGGFLSGLRGRRVKKETHKGVGVSDKQRWLLALLGGTIMGYGARFARGCTSGHALSGGAILSAGSWVFMFSIFAGAYAIAYFVRRFWQEEA